MVEISPKKNKEKRKSGKGRKKTEKLLKNEQAWVCPTVWPNLATEHTKTKMQPEWAAAAAVESKCEIIVAQLF